MITLRCAALAVLGAAMLLPLAAAPAAAQTSPGTYTVRIETVKSINETNDGGSDVFFGIGSSDEIYVGLRTALGTGPVGRPGDGTSTFVQTRLLGDFDAGETRTLGADQNCLTFPFQPRNSGAAYLSGFSGDRWQCLNSGNHAPFTITARMIESDTGACGPPCTVGVPASRVLDKRFSGDDHVDTATVSFARSELETDLPRAGMTKRKTASFSGNGGVYNVTFVVQRVT